MSTFRLLVVEDHPDDLRTCRETIERYRHEKQREVEHVECKDVSEAFKILNTDSTFDGAVIDLKLGNKGDEGNQVIQKIEEEDIRIPIVILTGTPASVDQSFTYVDVLRKGDPGAGYDDILDRFWRIHQTGLTRIMGGRGEIEARLGIVFRKNLIPQMKRWEEYGARDSPRTENALLRHTLNHLIQIIDEDVEHYFPEEFYHHPPLSEVIQTGSILQEEKNRDGYFVVMSPDCDLVIRPSGQRNTDRILVVEVIPPTSVFSWYGSVVLNNPDKNKGKRRELRRALGNNHVLYLHCLPQTDFFPLGFINFRNLTALKEEEVQERFKIPHRFQISPPFVKDIVSRFSTYYARQGQPEIDFDDFVAP